MAGWNPLNDVALAAQIHSQRTHDWDLETDIRWDQGVDLTRFFLPLDADAIAFPGANDRQRLALSQLAGLIINATIGEMEDVIPKFKQLAWENILRDNPVNPEMFELGELFFEEEAKHSRAFGRYIEKFCEASGVRREDLDRLLPKAFGSRFLRWTLANARSGGFVFWWVVAAVEEVSIEMYRHLHPHREKLDPLFFEIHRKHLEEEARHRNYAFLMLEMIHRRRGGPLSWARRKTDLVRAQIWSSAWLVSELSKVFEAEKLKSRHPFFATVAECLPLLRKLGPVDLARRLFVTGPFISLVLNQNHHRLTRRAAEEHGVLRIRFPEPRIPATSAGSTDGEVA